MKPFRGEGTVLMTEMRGSAAFFDRLPPMDALTRLKSLQRLLVGVIEKSGGTIIQSVGDSQLAFWTEAGHAQRAFDTATGILREIAKSDFREVPFQIFLGTGELSGEYMGTAKQFQIVGKAMAILDRLLKGRTSGDSGIHFSQYTAHAIDYDRPLSPVGEIDRGDLEPLKVYLAAYEAR